MAAYEALLLCSLLWILSPAHGKEVTITCVNSEDCVLPCQFPSDGKGVRVMWYKKGAVVSCTRYGNTSFIDGDHKSQADEYKGRTRLYEGEILKGDATLVLKNITLKDQGRYICITMTTLQHKESGVVTVSVKAPVQVNIQQEGNGITCSSEGIHPKPELTWSTNPPSTLTPKNPTILQTEQQLYNISSFLTLSSDDTDLVYSCTVSSGINRKRATLLTPIFISCSDREITIPCTSSNTPLTDLNLTWKFGHDQIILSHTNISYTVSEGWKQQVKAVSESGSLTLQDLNQEGRYMCELSNDEETYVTDIRLMREKSPGPCCFDTLWPTNLRNFLAIMMIISVAAAPPLAVVLLCCVWRQRYNGYREMTVPHRRISANPS